MRKFIAKNNAKIFPFRISEKIFAKKYITSFLSSETTVVTDGLNVLTWAASFFKDSR